MKEEVQGYIQSREEQKKLEREMIELEKMKESERRKAATKKLAQFRERVSQLLSVDCQLNLFTCKLLAGIHHNYNNNIFSDKSRYIILVLNSTKQSTIDCEIFALAHLIFAT